MIVSFSSSKILSGSNNYKELTRNTFALTIDGVTAKITVRGRSDQQNKKCLVQSTIDQEFYNRCMKYCRKFMIRKTASKEEPNHKEYRKESG